MVEKSITHEILQEEYLKNMENDKLRLLLHPAGGFDKKTGFVYEPIGRYKYVFYYKGYKGIGTAKLVSSVLCSGCGYKIIKQNAKIDDKATCPKCEHINKIDTVKWVLDSPVRTMEAEFTDVPIKLTLYNVPHEKTLDFWMTHFLTGKNRIEFDYVFGQVKEFYKTYFDFPIEAEVDLIVLSTIQSWLTEILDIVFYVTVNGETGSGKTALLEAMSLISRHGVIASSIKSSGIARVTERYKLSLFIDEIDQLKNKEDDIESICRQGYRKGQKYIRMQPKSLEPEFFEIFGFKAFSFRSDISDDLKNRSLDIPLKMSKSAILPVLNLFKKYNNPFELVFFWYLENIADIYANSPNFMSEMTKNDTYSELLDPIVNAENTINTINNNIYIYGINQLKRDTLSRNPPYLHYGVYNLEKSGLVGRNIEIAYLMNQIAKLCGIDLFKIIESTLQKKQGMEVASQEVGWTGILKEILADEFNHSYNKDGVKYVPYAQIMKLYVLKMRDIYGNIPSEYQLRKLLRQVGFIDGINRKLIRHEGKPALCLIYDTDIKKSLGIETVEPKKEVVA